MSLLQRLFGKQEKESSLTSTLHSGAPESAVINLKIGLQDPDPGKRAAAAVALGQIRDPAAISALSIARTDVDENVRNCAVDALDSIDPEWRKKPEARVAAEYELSAISDWLSPMLQKAEGLLVTSERVLELDRLAESKDERAFAALEEAIHDSDATIRMWAAQGFGKLGDLNAIPLLEIARTDFDERVRNTSEESLALLRGVESEGETEASIVNEVGENELRNTFKDEVIRFLSSENTKVYEAKNDAWWSHDDLKLVIAKEYSGKLETDELYSEADAAIEELAKEQKIKGTASGYRIAQPKRWEELYIEGRYETRPEFACAFCGDANVAVGYYGSHLKCANCGAIYCRSNCQLTKNGGCPGCGEVDRWNFVEG